MTETNVINITTIPDNRKIKYNIYPLDTINSVHERIAFNNPAYGKIIQSTDQPLLPVMIKLIDETPAQTTSFSGKYFTCSIDNESSESFNSQPIDDRQYKLYILYNDLEGILKNPKFNQTKETQFRKNIINGLIKRYELGETNEETYSTLLAYILYFIFEGPKQYELYSKGSTVGSSSRGWIDAQTINIYEILVEELINVKITSFIFKYETEKDKIQLELEKNKIQTIGNIKLFESIKSLSYDPIPSSNIKQFKSYTTLKFSIPIDIYELFNNIQMTPFIPFCSVNTFFKLLKDFQPPKLWVKKHPIISQNFENIFYIYVSTLEYTTLIEDINPNKYALFVLEAVDENLEAGLYNIKLTAEIDTDIEIDINAMFDRLFSAFGVPVSGCQFLQNRIECNYLIPNLPSDLDIPLFQDMIMNNPLIRPIMVIDESVKTDKKRGGIFSYFRYNTYISLADYIIVKINSNYVDQKNKNRLADDGSLLFNKLGEKFLVVTIDKVKSLSDAYKLRVFINNILSYYFDKEKSILFDIYSDAFSNIENLLKQSETIKPPVNVRGEMLKDLEPDIFMANYARKCQKEPTLLKTSAEIRDFEANNDKGRIMEFPQYGEGPNKRKYICNHKGFEFPVLIENVLPNRNKYPLIPCCASSDHSTASAENKLRYRYENLDVSEFPNPLTAIKSLLQTTNVNQVLRPSVCKKPFIINNIMRPTECAILPPNIDRFLTFISPNIFPLRENFPVWIREGSIIDTNSLFDPIIKAILNFHNSLPESDQANYLNFLTNNKSNLLSELFGYNGKTIADKLILFKKLRLFLLNFLSYNVSCQSTYEETNTQLKDYLQGDLYLDISLVWRLVEIMFKINIVLFRSDKTHPNGTLGSPKYTEGLLETTPSDHSFKFTVFLYEIQGSDNQLIEYPQIELIHFMYYKNSSTNNPIQISSFTEKNNKQLLKYVSECFADMYNSKGTPNIPIPNPFKNKIVGQAPDAFGKIRMFKFENRMTIITDPMPALNISAFSTSAPPEINFNIQPATISAAREFIATEGVTNVQSIKNIKSVLVGYTGILNNVSIYIPLQPTEQLEGPTASINPKAPIYFNSQSYLTEMIKLDQQAKYLIQYIMWIFSIWHNNKKGDFTSKEYIKQFAIENMEIIPGHNYPNIPRRLNRSLNGVFNENGKFIVPSVNVRNRLLYALMTKLRQNYINVITYWNRTYIKEYYNSVLDFTYNNKIVIVRGVDALQDISNSVKVPNFIYNHVFITENNQDIEVENIEDGEDIVKVSKPTKAIIPYFLQIETLPGWLGRTIFIAQKAINLPNAIYISNIWSEKQVNDYQSSKFLPEDTSTYTVIIYEGIDNTGKLIGDIKQMNGPSKNVVLIYKYAEELNYLSLLPYKQV